MSNDYPAVIPMIAYENGPVAMYWLARAFGLRERTRILGVWSEVPYIIDGVLVYMDDVDQHLARAKAAILSPVESTPDGKRHRAEDIEGHRWMFLER